MRVQRGLGARLAFEFPVAYGTAAAVDETLKAVKNECAEHDGMAKNLHRPTLVEQYKDKVNFVHIYTAEPHPRQPDANFDKGLPIEFPWSTVRQARSLDMRRKNARMIAEDLHEAAYFFYDHGEVEHEGPRIFEGALLFRDPLGDAPRVASLHAVSYTHLTLPTKA